MVFILLLSFAATFLTATLGLAVKPVDKCPAFKPCPQYTQAIEFRNNSTGCTEWRCATCPTKISGCPYGRERITIHDPNGVNCPSYECECRRDPYSCPQGLVLVKPEDCYVCLKQICEKFAACPENSRTVDSVDEQTGCKKRECQVCPIPKLGCKNPSTITAIKDPKGINCPIYKCCNKPTKCKNLVIKEDPKGINCPKYLCKD